MSFKRLDPEDISISAESIVAPAWSTDAIELKAEGTVGFFRSDGQVASNTGNFYHEVYHKATTAAPEGHLAGYAPKSLLVAFLLGLV